MGPLVARIPLWAALVPLGGYILTVGGLHLRRRPMVISGTWDLALLVAGIAGLIGVGPLALLEPAIGQSAWAESAAVLSCVMVVAMVLLATRPRLVVYNVTLEQLRPMLADVVGRLDAQARWAGETVVLPSRGIQLHLDGRGLSRCVSVVAVGGRTPAESWAEFARGLRRSLASLRVRRNPWGGMVAVTGLSIMTVALIWAVVTAQSADRPQPAGRGTEQQAPPRSVEDHRHARPRRSLGA